MTAPECPACGARLTYDDPEVRDDAGDFRHVCTNLECDYVGWHPEKHSPVQERRSGE